MDDSPLTIFLTITSISHTKPKLILTYFLILKTMKEHVWVNPGLPWSPEQGDSQRLCGKEVGTAHLQHIPLGPQGETGVLSWGNTLPDTCINIKAETAYHLDGAVVSTEVQHQHIILGEACLQSLPAAVQLPDSGADCLQGSSVAPTVTIPDSARSVVSPSLSPINTPPLPALCHCDISLPTTTASSVMVNGRQLAEVQVGTEAEEGEGEDKDEEEEEEEDDKDEEVEDVEEEEGPSKFGNQVADGEDLLVYCKKDNPPRYANLDPSTSTSLSPHCPTTSALPMPPPLPRKRGHQPLIPTFYIPTREEVRATCGDTSDSLELHKPIYQCKSSQNCGTGLLSGIFKFRKHHQHHQYTIQPLTLVMPYNTHSENKHPALLDTSYDQDWLLLVQPLDQWQRSMTEENKTKMACMPAVKSKKSVVAKGTLQCLCCQCKTPARPNGRTYIKDQIENAKLGLYDLKDEPSLMDKEPSLSIPFLLDVAEDVNAVSVSDTKTSYLNLDDPWDGPSTPPHSHTPPRIPSPVPMEMDEWDPEEPPPFKDEEEPDIGISVDDLNIPISAHPLPYNFDQPTQEPWLSYLGIHASAAVRGIALLLMHMHAWYQLPHLACSILATLLYTLLEQCFILSSTTASLPATAPPHTLRTMYKQMGMWDHFEVKTLCPQCWQLEDLKEEDMDADLLDDFGLGDSPHPVADWQRFCH
ncbi:hypothetical protein DACRYDRAFT_16417 [Dacryopinax primogenitus]|uniref:Uncharacterized protein n=1 Tax=Dacryopinax primogenitus (strain DJM 731) TaxID=1858805 RepID=M5GAV5_DACPD|nr:uncharacterized protein DACRYDRAFT_16417 [Dacryopinax primogenitus]EJU01063.1 hypothetical protein DACRYDRAFT_16417 [Dacryopinax primogenitus]